MIYKAEVKSEFVVGLDGSPLERPKVVNGERGVDLVYTWKELATVCASSTKKEPVKCWGLAQRLYKGEPFEIDKSDRDLIIELIKESGMAALMTAQLIEEIEAWPEA